MNVIVMALNVMLYPVNASVPPAIKVLIGKWQAHFLALNRFSFEFIGILGKNCEKQCAEGFYGDCTQKCNCTHGKCNPETGQCLCAVGWKGKSICKLGSVHILN